MSDNFFEIKQIDRDAVNYLIRNLTDFEKDKAVRSGLSDAGKVFIAGGKSRLKSRMKIGSKGLSGNLLRSFTERVKKSKPGVLVGFKQGANGGSHSFLIDKGTKSRRWKKNGKSTGKVTANYFWTDTEVQDNAKALGKLYQGIEKAVNRINNRR